MITPVEIENKEFSKAMRGYNPVEVDSFLDSIIVDLTQLLQERDRVVDENNRLKERIAEQKKSENSVVNTLESAKTLMKDISASAEKRAEIIIKNATLDADLLQRDAKDSVAKLLDEAERLKKNIARFKERYKELLEDEMRKLDGSSEDFFAELEEDFIPASLDVNSKKKSEETTTDQKEETKEDSDTRVVAPRESLESRLHKKLDGADMNKTIVMPGSSKK